MDKKNIGRLDKIDMTTKEITEQLLMLVEDAMMDNEGKFGPQSMPLHRRLRTAQDWLWELQDESENI